MFLELISYFVLTWIGCDHIQRLPTLNIQDNYDANMVDNYIRQQIIPNMHNRAALFPIKLWNMTDRVAEGFSRTNNSIEAFFHVWNTHLSPKPRLSKFMKRVVQEDQRWCTIVEDYLHNPADGIRGGLVRRKKWIRQDENLRLYLNGFLTTEPAQYLRKVAYKIAQFD